MTADFYLETIDQVFQRHLLPLGQMTHKGRRSSRSAIRKTFLLTVEGEKDDICAVGQTLAAQDLCSGLRPYMKTHHLQAGVGHYGVFNGRAGRRRSIRCCATTSVRAAELVLARARSTDLAGAQGGEISRSAGAGHAGECRTTRSDGGRRGARMRRIVLLQITKYVTRRRRFRLATK